MKQKKTVIRVLILVLAVCCVGVIYLSEKNAPQSVDEYGGFYIIDDDKKKYHRMDCAETEKIKSDHITIATSREMLKEQGYKGCKKCNP